MRQNLELLHIQKKNRECLFEFWLQTQLYFLSVITLMEKDVFASLQDYRGYYFSLHNALTPFIKHRQPSTVSCCCFFFFFSENRLNCPRWWIQQEQIALKFYLCFHCTPLLWSVRFKKLVWFCFIYHLLLCYQANNRYLVTNSGVIELIQGFIKALIHCLENINIEYWVSPSGMLSHSIIPSSKKSCWWF